VIVGAARHHVVAASEQILGQRLGVAHDVRGVDAEFGLARLQQRDRDAGGGAHVGPTLQSREHRLVDRRGVLGPAQNHAPAWTAQGLVGGGGDHVGVGKGRGVSAAGDEPGDVRHVDDEARADLARDVGHGREVPDP